MVTKDNVIIHFQADVIDKHLANVVIVHGIAEHLHRYDHLAKQLNQAGFNVFRYDLRGHGRTSGKRGYVKSLDVLLNDLHEIIRLVREKHSKRIFLLGHSLGGGIANIYASIFGDIDGYISSGAATQPVKQLSIFKIIPYQMLKGVNIDNNLAKNSLSTISEVEKDYIEDPFVLKKYKLGYLGEVMIKGSKRLNKNINNIKMPVLFMHGKNDPIVSVEFSKNMYNNVLSNDKELVIYEQSLHEIYNDVEREKVIDKTIEWLTRHA